MDITLPMTNGLYNLRVAVIIDLDGRILFERYKDDTLSLIGGRVQFNETLVEAAIREVKEEVGLLIVEPKLVACIENFYVGFNTSNNVQEHLFVFRANILSNAVLHPDIPLEQYSREQLTDLPIYPAIYKQLLLSDMQAVVHLVVNDIGELAMSDADLSFNIPPIDHGELHVRATAIIRDADGNFLMDHQFEPNPVPIGGRMHQFETSHAAVIREVEEELGVTPVQINFIGITEDFFDTDNRQIHFLGFVYEVLVDIAMIQETGEICLVYMPPNQLKNLQMKLASTKAFINAHQRFMHAVNSNK